ncbi:hypothetical protein BKA57DRAFT_283474 [Linnemannia elongata]|nr:hypothetical protein BKA57DRAFT_283474 [Linnemannia elongata]
MRYFHALILADPLLCLQSPFNCPRSLCPFPPSPPRPLTFFLFLPGAQAFLFSLSSFLIRFGGASTSDHLHSPHHSDQEHDQTTKNARHPQQRLEEICFRRHGFLHKGQGPQPCCFLNHRHGRPSPPVFIFPFFFLGHDASGLFAGHVRRETHSGLVHGQDRSCSRLLLCSAPPFARTH